VWYNSGGYQLGFDPDHIDLHRVRRLATRARELVGSGRHGAADASSLLAEACAQWRGTPLSGLKGDWADRVRTGLDHERLSLLTARFEADLACGRHTAAVGPLAAAYAEYPLAESLAGLLMLALHHTGRQAEALTVFTRIRRRLIDQIGDEPGKALQNLHARLLRRDPP
jgi:DNA-binding SARP family transcriptional activator